MHSGAERKAGLDRTRMTRVECGVRRPLALTSVVSLWVPTAVVLDTWSSLRTFGGSGNEGLVLWLGHVEGTTASVREAFTPPQASIQSEDGVGYFVTSQTLFELNRELHRSGLRLLAQIHSHPAAAYHSATDDAYAVVTAEGGFSVVVPDFAAGAPDPGTCAFYRLGAGAWRGLSEAEVDRLVRWGREG